MDVDEEDARIDRQRQMARDSLQRFRDVGRPFETHSSTTISWSVLPYPINALTWFVYYRLLDVMVRRTGTRVPLYICGTVLLPYSIVSYDLVRLAVYRLFMINTPYTVVRCFNTIKFRLLFVSTTVAGDRVVFQGLRLSTQFSRPYYHDYSWESE